MEYDEVEEYIFPEIEQKKTHNVGNSRQKEINFYAEIRSIMYAFGDVKQPLDSSVNLMHSILQGQMALLIRNAEDVMKLRNAKKISHEDILFLMRKNKVLLKRLLQFLHVLDMKNWIIKLDADFDKKKTKIVSQCLKFLAFIEKFPRDLTSILEDKDIIDHVHLKRLKRRDLMTSSMTAEEYGVFFEFTLKESFCRHSNEKFKKWLQQCSGTIFDITPLALSIIHFLARETIAEIIDKALEIKSRKFQEIEYFPLSQDGLNLGESENNSGLDELENNSDLDRSKNDFEINEPEIFFKMDESVDNTTNDIQKENTASNSSHLDQNTFSKHYASGKSDSNKKLSDNARKSERNYDVCDSFESVDDRFSGTYYVTDETSSTMNCESSSNQRSSDVVFHVPKKISKTPHFSVNFQEKPFSVCCDGSKTVEIGTSSASKAGRGNDTEDTKDKDLATSNIEFVEQSDFDECKTGFVSKSFSQDFDKYSEKFSYIAVKKTDAKIDWFPEDAITPVEIQAAFIEYQRPPPISVLLKTKISFLSLRKINLVCLANPDEI